jgi:hypothetical protein
LDHIVANCKAHRLDPFAGLSIQIFAKATEQVAIQTRNRAIKV